MEWKQEALKMRKDGEKVNDIVKHVKKSRKTVSKFLNSLDEKEEIRKELKEKSKEKRRAYLKEYKRNSMLDAQLIKRQHEIDVRVLSSERFFNE